VPAVQAIKEQTVNAPAELSGRTGCRAGPVDNH
jgi:hypothetical protein